MKEFAKLINTLDSTNKASLKQEALSVFLREASNADKLWLLALFTGKRPRRNINTSLLKQWVMEITGIPEWLFIESYSSVGDLAETISLLLPNTPGTLEWSLSEWMEKIISLQNATEEDKKSFVLFAWSRLDPIERFIFNKLIGGSFRMGISSNTLVNTISKEYQLDASAVTHSLMGEWSPTGTDFEKLIRGGYANTQLSKPYPFCLAYPLDKDLESLGAPDEWQVEYKWDGIRGQFIKRAGEVFIWSRGEELVTDQFPELRESLMKVPGSFVIDGEILAYKSQQVMSFSELQKRLNRKIISRKLSEEVPVAVMFYDLMELKGSDYRHEPLRKRRQLLQNLIQEASDPHLLLSEVVRFEQWSELTDTREGARNINSEGLMLKNQNSEYHTGRKRGDWWKWKVDPFTIDAVLLYAQRGSGRRSGYYTDYTFGVKKEGELVTIAKAYSGLTDKEIQEVSRFITQNTLEKFGPVRTVRPQLVFEIAFEGIGYSNRHKSGIALRFPRILRWRKDKTVDDIDDIQEIRKLIRENNTL